MGIDTNQEKTAAHKTDLGAAQGSRSPVTEKAAGVHSMAESASPEALQGAIATALNLLNKVQISDVKDIPAAWGAPQALIPQHPVRFRDLNSGESYEYYGRVADPAVDVIAQRWGGKDEQGRDKWKDASPVKMTEMQATYKAISTEKAQSLGLADMDQVYVKTTPTTVYFVPEGTTAVIHTREHSTEEVLASVSGTPSQAIAIDTEGKPYKFPYAKNVSPQEIKGSPSNATLPAAYVAVSIAEQVRDIVQSKVERAFDLHPGWPLYNEQVGPYIKNSVSVTDNGNTISLKISFRDLGEISEPQAQQVPLVFGEELRRLGVPDSSIKVQALAYKDYGFMCYSGALTVVLPNNNQSASIISQVDLQTDFVERAASIEKIEDAVKQYKATVETLTAYEKERVKARVGAE